jgi:hypothetical protein
MGRSWLFLLLSAPGLGLAQSGGSPGVGDLAQTSPSGTLPSVTQGEEEATEDGQTGPQVGALALIDRIVAVVGDRLVLASEVAFEQEVARRNVYMLDALAPRRTNAREWLVDMAIVRGLAGDVRVYEPSASDVADARQRLQESFADPADYQRFLARFGVTVRRLDSLIFSRLVAERYIQRNVGLGVSDAELAERYGAWIADRRQQVTIRQIEAREL